MTLFDDFPMPWTVWAKDGKDHNSCPDFLLDLNAVHEVEKAFDNTQWWVFIGHLTEICGGSSVLGVSATARQRTTAILKTLNRWNPEWDR